MKKFLFIILMMTGTMAVSAQRWERKTIEADAMKGQIETVMYEWDNGNFSFIIYDNHNGWTIHGVPFKPDPTHVNYRNNFETFAKIGFYDNDDNLLESWDRCCLELTNIYKTASSAASKKKKGQYAVSNYLKVNEGYVRIIIPTILGDDWDVTIPCMKNENK